MNYRLIGFSGLVVALVGIVVGIAAAEVSRNDFESALYQNLTVRFAIAGGVLGAATGASLESIRQLQAQQSSWQDDSPSSQDHH